MKNWTGNEEPLHGKHELIVMMILLMSHFYQELTKPPSSYSLLKINSFSKLLNLCFSYDSG